jgi:hypothetical protein
LEPRNVHRKSEENARKPAVRLTSLHREDGSSNNFLPCSAVASIGGEKQPEKERENRKLRKSESHSIMPEKYGDYYMY